MKPKHLHLLIGVIVAIGAVAAQNGDELPNPLEDDNQFPPENHADAGDAVEGSGDGITDTTTDASPILEDIQPTEETTVTPEGKISCPETCSCSTEGDALTVDCAGYDLTEFPAPIDEKTTTLNLRNNKLTEIPKSISSLKNLRVLDADNNSIMELKSGSISELPELSVLKLANNRLIEYPSDLKNSLLLNKLEELDLGGNDMRTMLDVDTFSNFESLRTLTLATSTAELKEDICNKLKKSLENICTGSCGTDLYECETDKPIDSEDDSLLPPTLPATITVHDDADLELAAQETHDTNAGSGTEETPTEVQPSDDKANSESASPVNNFSLRIAADNIPPEGIAADKPVDDTHQEAPATTDPNVGATTSAKTGGVDKSVIGIIVAAMVVVVAGVTIKKNWSSIRKRFSSAPRPANERVANGNGTAPEEVPLQDNKSPV